MKQLKNSRDLGGKAQTEVRYPGLAGLARDLQRQPEPNLGVGRYLGTQVCRSGLYLPCLTRSDHDPKLPWWAWTLHMATTIGIR